MSSKREEVKSTESGWRPSEYSDSVRYVVISAGIPSYMTVIVPCFIPVSVIFSPQNISLIFLGIADVAISKSCGVLPRRESLTHPPIIYASSPDFSIFSRIL